MKSLYIDAHSHNLRPEHDGILNIDLVNIPKGLPFDRSTDRAFSIGIHPWKVETHSLQFYKVQEYAQSTNCVAIGETGLDRAHLQTLNLQIASTIEHVKLANELSKPLIFHCVRAYQDLFHLLRDQNFQGKFMLHDYNGNAQTTKQFLDSGMDVFFSLGHRLFDSRSKLVKDIDSLPDNRILLETDDQSEFLIESIYKKFLKVKPAMDMKKVSNNYYLFIS